MTVDPISRLDRARGRVLRWVGFYTRSLPADVAAARRDELIADLHDHISESQASGRPSEIVARELQLRAFKGAPADLQWRRAQLRLASLDGRALSDGLLAASAVGAPVMAVVGLVATVRSVPLVWQQSLDISGATLFPIAAGMAAAICGLVLLARLRTRFLGALWLVVASQLVIIPAFGAVARTSTLLRLAEPALRGPLLAVSVGVGLFYLAIAIGWMPARRLKTLA